MAGRLTVVSVCLILCVGKVTKLYCSKIK